MHSIEQALVVDYYRRGLVTLLLTALTTISLPLFIYSALSWDGKLELNSPPAVTMHVVFTLMMGFGATIAAIVSIGSINRFFVRPISAARLVVCELTLGLLSVAGIYSLSASIINLGGNSWPVLGPTFFVATAFACVLAAIWCFEGSVIGQALACGGILAPLVIWFSRCYGSSLMGDWNRMWREPTPGELLTLIGLTAGAYFVAIVGVARVRRGDLWTFAAVAEWWEERLAQWHTSAGHFRTPFAAQLWLEWQQKFGPAPAVLVAVAMLWIMGLRIFGFQNSESVLQISTILPLTIQVFVMPLVFGILLGNCGDSKMRSMTHFYGTRPLTDRSLANAMLVNCAFVSLTTWITWFVGLSLVAGLVVLMGDYAEFVRLKSQLLSHWVQTLEIVMLWPVATWALLALMASLVATGREWLWGGTLMVSMCGLLGYVLMLRFLSYQQAEFFASVGLITVGVAFVLLTLAAYAGAVRRGLVTPSTAWTVAGLATAAVTALLVGWPASVFRFSHVALTIGNLALVFLPIASLPLAVQWNRHR